MNYYLYKLRFTTAVHFGSSDSALSLYTSGMNLCADTIFSALCHQELKLCGEEGLNALFALVNENKLVLSDSMPWSEDRYYLPKPCVLESEIEKDMASKQRKALKRLTWLPLDAFGSFVRAVSGNGDFNVGDAKREFGTSDEKTSVCLDEDGSRPYTVGIFSFFENCGNYIIVGCETEEISEQIQTLLSAAGIDGIGGKTSSGLGKFTVEKIGLDGTKDSLLTGLNQAIRNGGAKKQLLLTTALPSDDETDTALKDASFRLTRRGGFVQSETYSGTPIKKRTEHFLSAGSVLTSRFSGGLRNVGINGNHPVYRYSKPLFMGVDL